jgi:hypothetical protein
MVNDTRDEVHQSQQAEYQAGQEGHKPSLGLVKGTESQLKPAPANDRGEADPDEVANEESSFQRLTPEGRTIFLTKTTPNSTFLAILIYTSGYEFALHGFLEFLP